MRLVKRGSSGTLAGTQRNLRSEGQNQAQWNVVKSPASIKINFLCQDLNIKLVWP